jgi:outer membrane immunogenic protein
VPTASPIAQFTGDEMIRFFAALAALAFASGSALAADLPLPAPVYKAPPLPAPTWTGCYVDAGGGYGLWNVDQHTETFPGLVPTSFPDITDGGRGWLGRFGGGCDYQFGLGGLGNFVIGAFGDYDVMGLQGTNSFQNIGLGGAAGPPTSGVANESSAWYAGARVGYLVTPALLAYGAGGYTQTRFDQVNLTFSATGAPANAFLPSTTFNGWFIGSGYEYALNFSWLPISIPGLFWKTEYRFAEYQTQDVRLLGPGATPGFAQHQSPFVQTVTSSLVWRFNLNGPMVMPH